jgi:CRP/FNR family transcriptional regulator, cyclic AMP receptor protein
MITHTLEPILAKHPFFKGLAEEHLRLIVGCASNVRFNKGESLFREGEEANRFFLVRQGRIALETFTSTRSMTVQTIREGEVLGWSWLIPPYISHFNARAIEPSLAITIDGKCIRGHCEEDHDLGYELMKRVSSIIIDRLHSTQLQLLDVYGVHA